MSTEWLEETLIEAGRSFKSLRKAAPDGYRSYWPEYDLIYKEPEPMKMPVNMDLIDQVNDWMLSAPLSEQERKMIGQRYLFGYRKGWRKVGKACGLSHEHARNTVSLALDTLANWLKHNREVTEPKPFC